VKGVFFLGRIQGTARAVILHWYYQDGTNDCDLAEMMPGRRVTVDSPTIFRWVQRYAPGGARNVCAKNLGNLDEA
jgi:transposase-like protein